MAFNFLPVCITYVCCEVWYNGSMPTDCVDSAIVQFCNGKSDSLRNTSFLGCILLEHVMTFVGKVMESIVISSYP